MSLYVDSSQEEAFRLVTDYFTEKRMEIVASMPPSYVRAEIGSWSFWEFHPRYPKGNVEASICERDGGSGVNLILSFTEEYIRTFLMALFTSALIWTFLLLYQTANPWGTVLPFSENIVRAALLTMAVVAVEAAVNLFRISLTRRNLTEGFKRLLCPPSGARS